MLFGVLPHPLDLGLVQAARLLDLDRLLLVGAEVLRAHRQDAVGVDVELHLDLRRATRRGRNALQVELAEEPVVPGHRPLTLIHAHGHRRLVVGRGAEDLLPLGRHGRVALDQLREQTAFGLDAERERRDIEQEHVLHFAAQHAPLDRRAQCHDLVGIDALVRLLVEELLDEFLHLRNPGRATDEHDLVNVLGVELRVLERLDHRSAAPLDEAVAHLLELRPGDRHLEVLRPRGIGRDERQVDVGALRRGELLLGLLAGLLEPLQGHRVFPQVDPLLLLELIRDVVDQRLVEVVAAQVRVAVGADHAEHAVGHLEHRHVERAAAQVKHHDLLLCLLLQAVGERRRGRLVDDPHHLEAGDLAGVLGGLPLRVVEVGRHGDDGLVDLVAEVALSALLQAAEHLR